MTSGDHSDWGTGGGRGEGAKPSGWDGFGWADGSGGGGFGSGNARDRARAAFSRSVYVGRSAWTAPSIGQRIVGILVLALIVGLAVLIIVPAIVIGVVVLAAAAVYALVRGAFASIGTGPAGGGGRKNVKVMGERQ